MGVSIGDNNKIKNSTIAEKVEDKIPKKSFVERHSIIISIIVSFIVGFILLFSFWNDIILWIEGLL